jgi:hypothetical protein
MAASRTLTAAERELLWSRMADVRGADPSDYRRLDSRLHPAIAELVGAPSLVPLVAENRMRVNRRRTSERSQIAHHALAPRVCCLPGERVQPMAVEFRLLGDVEVRLDDRRLDIGHARQRCVLVALLVDVNRSVPVDQLFYRVWAERPPHRARNALAGCVSRLRSLLGDAECAAIGREPGGYVLTTDALLVDLHRFRDLVSQARATDDLGRCVNGWSRSSGLIPVHHCARCTNRFCTATMSFLSGLCQRHTVRTARDQLGRPRA